MKPHHVALCGTLCCALALWACVQAGDPQEPDPGSGQPVAQAAEPAQPSEPAEPAQAEQPAEPTEPVEPVAQAQPEPPPRPRQEVPIHTSVDGYAPAEVAFASHAFPPLLPEDADHRDGWMREDCLQCHESGADEAPLIVHRGMSEVLLSAKCRSCHLYIPGGIPEALQTPGGSEVAFAGSAFPPTLPVDDNHSGAWMREDCLTCHEDGVKDAPLIQHFGMSPLLLQAKCRTCHVVAEGVEE